MSCNRENTPLNPAPQADNGASTTVDPFDPSSYSAPGIMSPETGQAGAASEGTEDKSVQLIIFDMGHVFVDFEWEEVCRGFCVAAGMAYEDFRRVLACLGGLGYERGIISTAEFLRELNGKLGTALTLDEFNRLWNATFRENPEMAAFLQQLKERYPLYCLSNTNETHYRHLQDSFNVARHFQHMILSYEVGMAKPDPAIYKLVLQRSGLPAQRCVFVDDLPPNVAAAQAVGMHAIRFVGIDDLKQRLQALGLNF